MKYLCLLAVVSVHAQSKDYQFEDDESYEYEATIDPVRRALALASNNQSESRRLGGVYGLCAMDVVVPEFSALVCDPANSLPQICTLVCKQGYYSSGVHRDIACADAMCEGPCTSQKYECKGSQIKFAERACDVTRYVPCEEHIGLCIETVTENCSYSFYEEVSRPCCNYTAVLAPDDCWNSGCSGSCDNPGVYHYYSNSCADMCPPWRDPEVPHFNCSPCQVPTEFNSHVIVLSSNAATKEDIASEIVVGCEPGYWGNMVRSYCMGTDGSFYPPISNIVCSPCSEPPTIEGELFERVIVEANIDGTIGAVELRCLSGFVGESTFSTCDKNAGFWSFVISPYCDLVPTASVSPSASMSSLGFSELLMDVSNSVSSSANPTFSSTPTISASFTATMTPSATKSPRPPKVKGSRAPTQPPKLRVK